MGDKQALITAKANKGSAPDLSFSRATELAQKILVLKSFQIFSLNDYKLRLQTCRARPLNVSLPHDLN